MFRTTLSIGIAFLLVSSLLLLGCSRRIVTFDEQRHEMVRLQLKQRGITEKAILEAFDRVPREAFVLKRYQEHAYDDVETPIGHGESLDRPFENAIMLEALQIAPSDRVLEVGTGSGYLAAIMSLMAQEVFTIEIEPVIAEEARERLRALGFSNISVRTGDGFVGWQEHAPFNVIVLTASPPKVPEPLERQLAEGGRLLIPLGGAERFQELVLYTKKAGKLEIVKRLSPTVFVPMKGKVLE